MSNPLIQGNMGILKKGLLGLAIATPVYGGTRSAVNYVSKFFPGINSFKDPLIAGLAAGAIGVVMCLAGGGCKCCCKQEEEKAEE